jgi:hypothetical protein
MKNIFFYGIIFMLCAGCWMISGCANDYSDNAKAGELLLGLNNNITQEEVAFSIISALPSTQVSMQSSGVSSNISSTKEILTEINKNASSTFLKSDLSSQGPRKSVAMITDDSCEEGTCYTLSGTGNCANGGSMTFNDVKVNLIMGGDNKKATITGNMDGSATYTHCGIKSQNWHTYPEYINAVIDGTIAQYDQFEDVSVLLAGDILSGSYTTSSVEKGNRTVSSESISVNGKTFSQVQLNCTTDLIRTVQISNQTYVDEGNLFIMSGDYIDTITGRVTVDGTLGPDGEINIERIFNTETFRYHSTCTMDIDNFSASCSVRNM